MKLWPGQGGRYVSSAYSITIRNSGCIRQLLQQCTGTIPGEGCTTWILRVTIATVQLSSGSFIYILTLAGLLYNLTSSSHYPNNKDNWGLDSLMTLLHPRSIPCSCNSPQHQSPIPANSDPRQSILCINLRTLSEVTLPP